MFPRCSQDKNYFVFTYVRVCVCVCERERERERSVQQSKIRFLYCACLSNLKHTEASHMLHLKTFKFKTQQRKHGSSQRKYICR